MTASAAPANPPAKAVVRTRPGRFRDIGALSRIYRSQSEDSRRLYHPFPFDRPRLAIVFAYMVGSRMLLRTLLRRWPRRALVLLVACQGDDPAPIGYGNVAFLARPGKPLKAIFGYIVAEKFRGLGVGTRLHEDMIDAAIALGVTRGGGMVVSDNVSNLRVLEKLGFEIRESDVVDRIVPGVTNYETDGDLIEIARRWHLPASPSGPNGGRA
jgi:RimJ/RimL family protein N-acetyltransferase